MLHAFGKLILRTYFRILFSFHYEGLENIPKDTTVILTPNHRTYYDPPFVGCTGPGKISFMAKEELFDKKLFAWLIRKLGAIPVARGKGDFTVIDTAVDTLNNGRSFLVFPEGTRSKDGKIGRGHTGAALIAAKSGKPVVPVAVIYGKKLKFRSKVLIKYGKPIYPQEYVESQEEPNPRQLVKLKNRYMADLKELAEADTLALINAETAPEEEVKEENNE